MCGGCFCPSLPPSPSLRLRALSSLCCKAKRRGNREKALESRPYGNWQSTHAASKEERRERVGVLTRTLPIPHMLGFFGEYVVGF